MISLLVLYKLEKLPPPKVSVVFVHKLMKQLGIEFIKSEEVYGKQIR